MFFRSNDKNIQKARYWLILFFSVTLLGLLSRSLSAGSDMKSVGDLRLANAQVHQPGIQATIALEPVAFLPIITRFTDGIVSFGPVHTGEGTYYNATGAGNCL
ncbi:MAG: hypothetical protein AMJ56_01495, partial [Anaerolineae bacterium SG8_19]